MKCNDLQENPEVKLQLYCSGKNFGNEYAWGSKKENRQQKAEKLQ